MEAAKELELVRRMKKGERAAFDELYEQYYDRLYRTACMITGNSADGEDVTQETFIKAYVNCDKLKKDEQFSYWLYRILNRTAWQIAKKHVKERPEERILELADTSTVDSPAVKVLQDEQERVAAAVCALTGTVCMAGGKIAGYVGGTRAGSQTSDFSDIGKLEKTLDLAVNAPEAFDNGYAFADASIADFDALDEDGIKVGNESELAVMYEKDGKRLHYTVKKGATILSDEEIAGAQVIEKDGITYYYMQHDYLFLPHNEEPTAEEVAAQDAGSLYISYGSDERQEQTSYSLWWNVDGQSYSLMGFDLDLSAQEMVDMALQIK